VSILIGLGLGILIDNRFDSKPFGMLLFILFGTAAGFLNVYRMATKEDGKSDDDSSGE
jgi:ATP synthase protein I